MAAPAPDWSNLHRDLLEQVALKVGECEDFMAFRGVCTSWRGSITKDKFRRNRIPLLLIPPEEGGESDVCEIYSLHKKKILTRIAVPETKGKRCISVGFGWILAVSSSNGDLNLVNPISLASLKPPNLITFPRYEVIRMQMMLSPSSSYMKAVLTANPSETSDFALVVAANKNLGFWRSEDSSWTKITMKGEPDPDFLFADICYYKQKVYAIDTSGQFWVCDLVLTKTAEIILELLLEWVPKTLLALHLVESSKDELLVIGREEKEFVGYLEAFRIDTEKREYSLVDSFDGDAIFTGKNSGAAADAGAFQGGVDPNCVYFANSTVLKCSEMIVYVVNFNCSELHSEWLGLDGDYFSREQPSIII